MSHAIRDLLNLLFIMLSKVSIWGLGVRGVLTPDDGAGKAGLVGVGGGFVVLMEVGGVTCGLAGRVESVNWLLNKRFLEGIVLWFQLMELISEFLVKNKWDLNRGLYDWILERFRAKKHWFNFWVVTFQCFCWMSFIWREFKLRETSITLREKF